MSKFPSKTTLSIGLIILLMLPLAVPAVAGSVNKSVRIEAGTTVDEASSVNGSVTVGEGATVTDEVSTVNGAIRIESNAVVGDVSTVNGSLRIADEVKAKSLETVNGAIDVDRGASVERGVETVNGSIDIAEGGSVGGDLSNVNGRIEVTAGEVGGDLATVNGDIYLNDGAILRGDLLVEKPGGWGWNNSKRRNPTIVIGPNSKVFGMIRLEREVELYISDRAEVGGVEGEMSMADAVRFSGNRP